MSVVIGQRILFTLLLLTSCALFSKNWIFNNPYPARDSAKKIYYTSFTEQPKTLDIAKAYSSNEILLTAQIYEPLLQYDYWARPYQLTPLTASQMPIVHYYDKQGQRMSDPTQGDVAKTTYTINIKPGILYQPHPAFAKATDGHYIYYPLRPAFFKDNAIKTLHDFRKTGTRELTVDDYMYQIKRLANPAVNSPIYGVMSQHILGFREYAQTLPSQKTGFLDLRDYPLAGLRKIDNYTFEITLTGQFAQFQFWLAMPFFAPIPWEADRFYSQAQMNVNNLNFSWYPVGTGAFMLSDNNPNSRMVLDKNPNYHDDFFPNQGHSLQDERKGYLRHVGERLPMIDRAVFILEKESIPRWSKFMQGYYDLSGISADSFDKAIQLSPSGEAVLSKRLQNQGMRLERTPELATYYLGFNMLDPIVGGQSEAARKLRQAISIAINYDEYITIFFNRRGSVAQGPIPPGIFGHHPGKKGINADVYTWDGRKAKNRSIAEAKALMREAGYPDGQDSKTGSALILHYDLTTTGGPDDKAEMDWMRKQFAQLGIELDVRATQYNRFQEKMRNGNAQLFKWAWSADYPDPENFLFILYGPNGKVAHGGENASNYSNPKFDQLFDQMKNRPNDRQRMALIDQMVTIVRHDAPWVWGMNTELFSLSQQWIAPIKPNPLSSQTYKYVALDIPLRTQTRETWNQPILWPLVLFLGLMVVLMVPFLVAYYKKQREHARRQPKTRGT